MAIHLHIEATVQGYIWALGPLRHPPPLPMNATAIEAKHYRATDALPDGSAVYLRAIRADDKRALREGLAGFSADSAYQRFLGIKKSFTDAELVAYTEPDFIHHVALVVEIMQDGQRLPVAVGRYFTDDNADLPSAEVSFAVHDNFQHRGIGTVLLRHLVHVARESGLVELRAWVMSGNRGMLGVFEHAPEPSRLHRQDSLIEVTLSLV